MTTAPPRPASDHVAELLVTREKLASILTLDLRTYLNTESRAAMRAALGDAAWLCDFMSAEVVKQNTRCGRFGGCARLLTCRGMLRSGRAREAEMRCKDCRGRGKLAVLDWDHGKLIVRCEIPCSSCGGSGQQSCCEGAVGNAGDVTNEGRDDG